MHTKTKQKNSALYWINPKPVPLPTNDILVACLVTHDLWAQAGALTFTHVSELEDSHVNWLGTNGCVELLREDPKTLKDDNKSCLDRTRPWPFLINCNFPTRMQIDSWKFHQHDTMCNTEDLSKAALLDSLATRILNPLGNSRMIWRSYRARSNDGVRK